MIAVVAGSWLTDHGEHRSRDDKIRRPLGVGG